MPSSSLGKKNPYGATPGVCFGFRAQPEKTAAAAAAAVYLLGSLRANSPSRIPGIDKGRVLKTIARTGGGYMPKTTTTTNNLM